MRSLVQSIAFASALALSLASASARADEATAEALFDRGVALMKERRFDEACPVLARAVDATAQPAVGGLLVLAECHESAGRPATAWAVYRRASAVAGTLADKRKATADDATARLERTMPRVVVVVAPELAAAPGLRITRAGAEVPREMWSVGVPVDPGEHALLAELPGRAPHPVILKVGTTGRYEARIDRWDDARPPVGAPLTPPPQPMSPATPPPSGLELHGILGIVAGGAGAVAAGVGLGVAFDAKSKYDAAIANPAFGCSGGTCLLPGKTATDSARTQGDVGTALLVAGSAVAATGVVLLVIDLLDGPKAAPRTSGARRWVTPRGQLLIGF